MLHYASQTLHRRTSNGISKASENLIDQHKNEFTHLFLENGKEIKSLRDIPPTTSVLVCCLGSTFKGLHDSRKIVDYHQAKVVKNQNIKNCLFNKTFQWSKEKMLDWNSYNQKVDENNKLIDLTNHIEGVMTHKDPQKTLSPFMIHKREKLQ